MRTGVVAILLLCVGGCAATHSIDDDVAILRSVFDAECGRVLACQGWTDAGWFPCDPAIVDAQAGEVRAGRARVDVEAARECLAGIAALGDCTVRTLEASIPLDPAIALEATCNRVFRQDQALCGGAPCDVLDFCVPRPDCSASCIHAPRAGEPCLGGDIPCSGGNTCVDGVCAPAPNADTCQGGGLGASSSVGCIHYLSLGAACARDDTCGPVAYCARSTRVCVDDPPALPLGAACAIDADPPCSLGLVCDDATLRCVSTAQVNGYCDSRLACGGETFCNEEHECTADADGSLCTARAHDLYWFDECPEGYLCAPSLRCRSPLAIGDACDDESACPLGTRCANDGHCRAMVLDGAPCDDATPCRTRAECVHGACQRGVRRGLPGGPCLPDGTCTRGSCDGELCALPGPGDPCTSTDDCATCVDGICQMPETITRGGACTIGDRSRVCETGLRCTFGSPSIAPAYCCE